MMHRNASITSTSSGAAVHHSNHFQSSLPNNENFIHQQQHLLKKNGSFNSSSSNSGFKTPSSKFRKSSTSKQRRAFGDISNKKPGSLNGGGSSWKEDTIKGTTPVVRKLHSSTSSLKVSSSAQKPSLSTRSVNVNTEASANKKKYTGSSSLFRQASKNSTSDDIKTQILSTQLPGQNEFAGRKPEKIRKNVNFRLPITSDTEQVALAWENQNGDDFGPIELPGGRTWEQQQRQLREIEAREQHEEARQLFGSLNSDDRWEAVFARRRQKRMEDEERIEREGDQLIRDRVKQVAAQDEADDRRYAEEHHRSLEALIQTVHSSLNLQLDPNDFSDDFLDVSF